MFSDLTQHNPFFFCLTDTAHTHILAHGSLGNGTQYSPLVLPAHTSHITQPLDVAVFGPFKRYNYSECADYMRQNMGKTITRYQIASMACTAYLKAMSPWNIVSSFKKTGIFPLNKDTIAAEKMMPCEPFRNETPVEKVHAMRGGKEAVDAYFLKKMEEQQVERPCDCKTKKRWKGNNDS